MVKSFHVNILNTLAKSTVNKDIGAELNHIISSASHDTLLCSTYNGFPCIDLNDKKQQSNQKLGLFTVTNAGTSP